MTIELAQLPGGKLIIASNREFTAEILRVEYYIDQKLFVLVYDTPDRKAELMPYELDDATARRIVPSPDIMVIVSAREGQEPYGYDVPFVKVSA